MNTKSSMFYYKLIFLLLLLFQLFFPYSLFSQPKNWVHFFSSGDMEDPMIFISADTEAVIWPVKSNGSTKTLFKVDVNENYDCKTNLTQMFSIIKSYSQYIVSKNDNCIYLFTPDTIYRIDKNYPDKKT